MRIKNGLIVPLIVIGLFSTFWAAKDYYITSKFIKESQHTKGIVLKNSLEQVSKNTKLHFPVVQFTTVTDDTIIFKSSTGNNPAIYKIGTTVNVCYDKKNNKTAVINSFLSLWSGIAVKSGVGILFLLIGIPLLYRLQKQKQLTHWLKRNGIKLTTTITNIKKDDSVKINWRNPYKIHSEWKSVKNNKTYNFTSNEIWFNPTSFIKEKTIIVWVKKENFNIYWMNTDFLPLKPDKLAIINQELYGKIDNEDKKDIKEKKKVK